MVGPLALAGYAIGSSLLYRAESVWPGDPSLSAEGRSIGEFAEACYGQGVRRWVTLVSILYMACFLAAELTAIGAIASLLSEVPSWLVVMGVAVATLVYTAVGGLRASLATDRWQGWLLLALLVLVVGVVIWVLPPLPENAEMPTAPSVNALSVALT